MDIIYTQGEDLLHIIRREIDRKVWTGEGWTWEEAEAETFVDRDDAVNMMLYLQRRTPGSLKIAYA